MYAKRPKAEAEAWAEKQEVRKGVAGKEASAHRHNGGELVGGERRPQAIT